MNGVLREWPLLLALAAVCWLLPHPGRRGRGWGMVLGLAALVAAGVVYLHPTGAALHDGLFYLFSASAVVSAVCMITNSNPVYAALWFALVTLSTCGLYLLQSAPFLAAATVVVYAGAIIVTFLFVIMLARQAGSAPYDRSAREPFVAALTAFVLLGAIFHTLGEWRIQASGDASRGAAAVSEITDGLERAKRFVVVPGSVANPLSRPSAAEFGTMHGLGRSLFGDYLFAVELAGTLLLVACVGAILIAPRRSQEGP
jgi:NADH-quinone oxidoreductase subunit J